MFPIRGIFDGVTELAKTALESGADYDHLHHVRQDDPVESEHAAEKVNMTADRLLVLIAFRQLGRATYRQAAERAIQDSGFSPMGETLSRRFESLRRRGSDLKRAGLIEQVGREDGQAIFSPVTDATDGD